MKGAINLRSLDILRGLLAVYVLLGHCRWLLWAGHSNWMSHPHAAWQVPIVYASAMFRFGHEAVMIFFVLSGFFIHLRMAEPPSIASASLSPATFYQRRIHRLGAPYAFALVVTLACDAIGRTWFPTLYLGATGDLMTDGVFRHTGYSWQSVAPALFILPSGLGEDFGTNGPLWSLAYEVIYYALYPAWFSLRQRSVALAYGVIPLACLALALAPAQPFLSTVLIHYPIWIAGAALAETLVRRQAPLVPGLAAVALFAAGLTLHLLGGSMLITAIAAVIFGSAAVLFYAGLGDRVVTSSVGRLFEYLGARSYSIYITHFPFVALMGAVLIDRGGRPMHGWFAAAGAVAAVAFGCLCFEACERHFVHHRLPAAGAAA